MMYSILKYSIVAVLSMLTVPTVAQVVLPLDSCVAMALRNNEKIKAAAKQTEQYQHTQKSYYANFFPNITGSVTDIQDLEGRKEINIGLKDFVPQNIKDAVNAYLPQISQALSRYLTPEMMAALSGFNPSIGIGYKVGNVLNAGINVEQPIYMGGKISTAYRMSKIGTRMAQVNEVLTRDEVVVSTHEAYALLLQAMQMHDLAVQYDSLLTQLKTDVLNAERHGMCSHNDVLKVEVKKTEAKLQVKQAENGIRLAQMNLCYNIGVPLTDYENLKVEPLTLTISPVPNDATIAGRPEYQLLELKSQLSAEQIKLTRSDFLPQVGVMFSYGYLRGLELMDKRLFDNNAGAIVLNVSIPIFHAREGHHKVKAAKLEHERNLSEQKDLVLQMNLEMQQYANALNESILELDLTQRNIESAEENLRARRKSYELGLETLTELLEAQTLWQEACAKQTITRAQCIVNMVKYRKACGTL